MKRIAILGEMGSGNLGDDLGYILLRDELLAAFREHDELVEVAPASVNTPVDANHWHAVVTGCGTLLDHIGWTYVQRLNQADVPVAVLGTGVADPRYAVPTAAGKRLMHRLERISVYTWRRGIEGPDTAWLAGWLRPEGVATESLCGFNFGPTSHNTITFNAGEFVQARVALRSHRSILLAAFPDDMPYLSMLLQAGDATPPVLIDGTRRGWAELSRCATVFCTRVHLAVFAACCGVHPVLLDYTGKVRGVFAGTTVPFTVLPNADPQALAAALEGAAPVDQQAVITAQAACKANVRNAVAAIIADWRQGDAP